MRSSKINIALIVHIISVVIIFESLFMLFAIAVSVIYHEDIIKLLLETFAITFSFGMLLNVLTRKQNHVEPTIRESFVIVTIAWFAMGAIGTMPYIYTNSIPDFTNAFFESISGFTTTGSSILNDIEAMPKSILFWRAETHWLGGMGIIVLVVAIMPFLKINGIYLFQSESGGVDDEKISTKISKVARSLWGIYLGLTISEIIILWISGMPLFDSICHSFATIATGGFSTKNDSIASYSPLIQYIITVFMLLSGINFMVHALLLRGKVKTALKNEELRLYLEIIFVAVAIITAFLFYQHKELGFEHAFRDSFFQVVSIITATGFATCDYLQWPIQAVIVIALLMLIGASSGSTGGGVKVIRHLIMFKRIKKVFKELISPKTIKVIRYNGKKIKPQYISRVLTFILVYYAIIAIGSLIMMLWTNDFPTSFGAVATSMAGIGPGFGTVGPVSNFAHLPAGAKYFMTVLMVIGRLEIYSVIVIFTKPFWQY
jgi:trk system potassium uptake protein TrkH